VIPRLHDFSPEQFPLTIRILSGTTGELLWSRVVTLDEAREITLIQVPCYAGTAHYPVHAEVEWSAP
jgi:hypothetical protein